MSMPFAAVIEWLPYQKRYKEDRSRFKIAHWSRQAGKSLTNAGESFDDCLEAMIAGKRERWVILSRGERQSKEVMDEALKPMGRAYWSIYDELRSGFDPPTVEEGVYRVPKGQADRIDNDYKTLEMIFPGGSRITAVPANPDTARGFSANLLLDEFALHADSEKIWAACFPIVSRAGLRLRVASTGNGKKNMFYKLMTNGDRIWSRHVIDIHTAIREGLERNADELRRGLNDEPIWQQEYECAWLDDLGSLLAMEDILSCESDDAGIVSNYQGGAVYLGNDIGARSNLWVLVALEEVGDVLVTREVVTLKNKKFAEHDAVMADFFDRYKVVRLAMDQTGMGEKPVEDARRLYGEHRVDGVLFGTGTKLDLGNHLLGRTQGRRIRYPQGDDLLRADLTKVKKVQGPTGGVRLVAEDDEHGHADRFWAFALACAAAAGEPWEAGYTPVNTHGRDRYVGTGGGATRFTNVADPSDDDMQHFIGGLRRGKYH
jgi:phage FluMu gp28-like protein